MIGNIIVLIMINSLLATFLKERHLGWLTASLYIVLGFWLFFLSAKRIANVKFLVEEYIRDNPFGLGKSSLRKLFLARYFLGICYGVFLVVGGFQIFFKMHK